MPTATTREHGGDNPWDFGTASQYPTINNVADAQNRSGHERR